MTADNPLLQKGEHSRLSLEPLEAIENLCQEGKIIKAITIEYLTPGDEDYHPTVHTHIYIAPTKPATNIPELNELLKSLPEPDFPQAQEEQEAEFVSHWGKAGKTRLPQITYFREAATITFEPTGQYHTGDLGVIQSIMKNIPRPLSISFHHTINVAIYPTAEIAQALAAEENKVLSKRNSRDGKSYYAIRDFDSSRPTANLNRYSDREIYDMEYSLPPEVWDPKVTS